ncbi:universal stress protein [Georgenia sp. 10Sc9-8]|uniref:Universal stress protein n=1 Tax=Georgenia halotolerans TaxID=3028317 RepID=A0ABT5TZI6_9MICO|nr:universal stress protein [Georgenia halotolerans]
MAERHPDVRVDLHDERGHPVEVLRRASRTASLLMLGTRGRGGLASLVLGSVGLGVLGVAACTVVIVRGGQPGATPPGAA